MSARLRRIAADNQDIAERGRYTAADGRDVEVADALAAAIAGTRAYAPDEPADCAPASSCADHSDGGSRDRSATTVRVSGSDTIAAARQLLVSGSQRVAVLNFASARNPGGGYVNGAKAQEEDICRKTLLYSCLLTVPAHYEAHRASRDAFYSHRLVYSPAVPVIRDRHDALTAPMVTVDVITSAAPNAGVIERDRPDETAAIPRVLTERARRVLACAAEHGVRGLVLGAWGCGVFRNDPAQVAEAFRVHLTGDGAYRHAFSEVVFAVVDNSVQQRNRRAFDAAFGQAAAGPVG